MHISQETTKRNCLSLRQPFSMLWAYTEGPPSGFPKGCPTSNYIASSLTTSAQAASRQKTGLKIKDEIMEINALNVADKRIAKLLLAIPAGTKLLLHIKRGMSDLTWQSRLLNQNS
jgi:hypothetical protein